VKDSLGAKYPVGAADECVDLSSYVFLARMICDSNDSASTVAGTLPQLIAISTPKNLFNLAKYALLGEKKGIVFLKGSLKTNYRL
jgi:hypothetical protein